MTIYVITVIKTIYYYIVININISVSPGFKFEIQMLKSIVVYNLISVIFLTITKTQVKQVNYGNENMVGKCG